MPFSRHSAAKVDRTHVRPVSRELSERNVVLLAEFCEALQQVRGRR
jgi:hypothetical protein